MNYDKKNNLKRIEMFVLLNKIYSQSNIKFNQAENYLIYQKILTIYIDWHFYVNNIYNIN